MSDELPRPTEWPVVALQEPSADLAARLAPWIADTDPEFYGLLDFQRQHLEAAIANLIREPNSDLAPLWVGGSAGDPLGLICAYDSSQMRARQILSLRLLLASHPSPRPLGSQIKGFAAERAAVSGDAFYLGKIYVVPEQRGRGLADALLLYFMEEGKRSGRQLCALHVRKDNAPAICLYRRHGFVTAPLQVGGRYLLLERRLD